MIIEGIGFLAGSLKVALEIVENKCTFLALRYATPFLHYLVVLPLDEATHNLLVGS